MLHFSLWTSHRILDTGSVRKTLPPDLREMSPNDKSDKSQIHTVVVQDQPSRRDKVANVNGTQSKEEWNQLSVEQTRKKAVTTHNRPQHRQPRSTPTSSRHHVDPSSTPQPNSTKFWSSSSTYFLNASNRHPIDSFPYNCLNVCKKNMCTCFLTKLIDMTQTLSFV